MNLVGREVGRWIGWPSRAAMSGVVRAGVGIGALTLRKLWGVGVGWVVLQSFDYDIWYPDFIHATRQPIGQVQPRVTLRQRDCAPDH